VLDRTPTMSRGERCNSGRLQKLGYWGTARGEIRSLAASLNHLVFDICETRFRPYSVNINPLAAGTLLCTQLLGRELCKSRELNLLDDFISLN
jgi:hypothetical protein